MASGSFASNVPVQIAVIGSGYVGLVAAACFAEIGHSVVCVDNDESKIAQLVRGETPIHEDLLSEILARNLGTRLRFDTQLSKALAGAEAVFIAVGTPPLNNGDADLSYVESVAAEVGRSLKSYAVIVEKSTVPVYTNQWITRVLALNGVDSSYFDVVSNPEFLREGTAVADFLHPDRIVVGADSDRAFGVLARIYEPLSSGCYYRSVGSVPGKRHPQSPPPLLRTSTKGAELIKHASNAFLAMKISFINSVASVCEAVGADISEVAKGIGMDSRIGPGFLSPGLGYGGSCFPKDLRAFRSVASHAGVNLDLLAEVEKINLRQRERFVEKTRAALWTLRGKKLGVLGLAFKGGTDDLRESPAIEIVRALLAEGASVIAYDPAAMRNATLVLTGSVRFAENAYAAAENSDALIILTDWNEFAELDLGKVRKLLHYPIVIDGRNLYRPDVMRVHGFHYVSMGRPPVLPKLFASREAIAEQFK
jgi:UDPglucose 6-dehydrogenase